MDEDKKNIHSKIKAVEAFN